MITGHEHSIKIGQFLFNKVLLKLTFRGVHVASTLHTKHTCVHIGSHLKIKPSGAETETFRQKRPTPRPSMPWLLESPMMMAMDKCLSSVTRELFNHLRHLSGKKWKYFLYFCKSSPRTNDHYTYNVVAMLPDVSRIVVITTQGAIHSPKQTRHHWRNSPLFGTFTQKYKEHISTNSRRTQILYILHEATPKREDKKKQFWYIKNVLPFSWYSIIWNCDRLMLLIWWKIAIAVDSYGL